jgi:hypothetical protein
MYNAIIVMARLSEMCERIRPTGYSLLQIYDVGINAIWNIYMAETNMFACECWIIRRTNHPSKIAFLQILSKSCFNDRQVCVRTFTSHENVSEVGNTMLRMILTVGWEKTAYLLCMIVKGSVLHHEFANFLKPQKIHDIASVYEISTMNTTSLTHV